jgi:hypothetical protein
MSARSIAKSVVKPRAMALGSDERERSCLMTTRGDPATFAMRPETGNIRGASGRSIGL